MKRILAIGLGLVAFGSGLLGAPGRARADLDFTFSSTPTMTAASANPPGTVDTITNGITLGGRPAATFDSVATSGSTHIALIGENTSGPFDATGGQLTQFLTVEITSSDSVLRTYSVNFDVAYTLTDPTPSGGPGPQVIHFLAKLTGQIDSNAGDTNVSFSLPDFNPALGTGPIVTAGDGTFHVTLDSFVSPGLGADHLGHLTALVAPVPEPSSLALLGVGLVGASLVARWRRRRV